tara:strand:+ start:218 stop:436 length:219 start_codon:yes stop_codon:yes gene_type:complete
MSVVSFFVVVFILWLIFFFIFLPIGLEIPEKHKFGHANSSPKKSYLFKKIILSFITSLISSLIFYYFIKISF